MAGDLVPSRGQIKRVVQPYYVPQLTGRQDETTIAQAMRIGDKWQALQAILAGQVTDALLESLDEDWEIEKRCAEALADWGLGHLSLDGKMGSLSGGEKTRVLLAGIAIHKPPAVLLDEPSNHLDGGARAILYDYVRSAAGALVVVSHARSLLRLLPGVVELSKKGIKTYGGDYDFFVKQRQLEDEALQQGISDKEKEVRRARESARESMERQQRLEARGRGKQEKAGLPTILLKTFQNNAEKTGARLKGIHTQKIGAATRELDQLRNELADPDKMRMNLESSSLHRGKLLLTARKINHCDDRVMTREGEAGDFGDTAWPLWKEALSFELRSGWLLKDRTAPARRA
jgi:ATPase subunit of ABC transporter with duplicated ATPase domains